MRAQHQRELFWGPSGQALAAGCRVLILLFPHLPCQAWPDGQLCVSANYTSGFQGGLAAREPCIGRRLLNLRVLRALSSSPFPPASSPCGLIGFSSLV